MYLTLKNHYNNTEEIPFILNIFKDNVLPKMNENHFNKIEKKLVTIYDEDIIPTQFKKLLTINDYDIIPKTFNFNINGIKPTQNKQLIFKEL
jgi:hypothetical protein